jgi:type III restriction enzyme
MLRKKRTSAGYKNVANNFVEVQTKSMFNSSLSYTALRNDCTIFYSSNCKQELDSEQLEIFNFIINELPRKQAQEINVFDFKTPHNLVVVSKSPENDFVKILTKKDVAKIIDCWIKSRNVKFYSITYWLKRGTNPKEFNPDFFIKIGDRYIVIETKADNDTARENYSKMIDAQKHFAELNAKLKQVDRPERYYFNILSPISYPTFEAMLKDGTYFNGVFNSDLEDKLKKEYRNKNE